MSGDKDIYCIVTKLEHRSAKGKKKQRKSTIMLMNRYVLK